MKEITSGFILALLAVIVAVLTVVVSIGNHTPISTLTPTNTAIPTAAPSPTPIADNTDCNRLSYNINALAIPDMGYLTAHLERLNPCVILVMDGFGLAMEFQRLFPDAIIIHREYSRAEGDEWRNPVNYWIDKWEQERRTYGVESDAIWRHTSNEPTQWDVASYVAAEVRILEEASRHGFHVVCCNISVGNYLPQAVDSGAYDPLLRAVVEGNHLFGVHEYTTGGLSFGFGLMPRSALLDSTAQAPENWTKELIRERIPFPNVSQSVEDVTEIPFGVEMMLNEYQYVFMPQSEAGMLPPHWHLGRSIWFDIRRREIGLPPIRFVLTESFWDNLSDIGDETLQALRRQFGLERYMRDMRGINSYPRLWTFYWGNWTQARAACEQLLYVDSVYPGDLYLGFASFTWSSVDGWASFDMSGMREVYLRDLHGMLENRNCG